MSAAVWADVMHLRCGGCGAEPNEFCTFVVDGKKLRRHCPCVVRLVIKEAS